ncbi:MAG: hypothetical protein K2N65_06105, partial [Anaeroplasmataceae bacterium]|nr:hypothetical protein [Anaeroplasmataceae bacterium]
IKYVSIACIVLFAFGFFLLGFGIIFLLWKKKNSGFLVYITYQLLVTLTIFFLHIGFHMLSVGAIVLVILNGILMTLALLLLLHNRIDDSALEIEEKEQSPKQILFYKRIVFLFETLTLIVLFTIFFIPLFTQHLSPTDVSYVLINALSTNTAPIYVSIIFIVLFLAFFICLLYYANTISYYFKFKLTEKYVKRAKRCIYSNAAICLVYFILGFAMTFYNNIKNVSASTISYIPFIISICLICIYSIFQGKLGLGFEEKEKVESQKKFRLEPLFFILVLTGITYLSLFFNLLEIKIRNNSYDFLNDSVSLSGYQLLTTYQDLGAGYQGLAFALFAMLFISGMALIVCVVSFFAKYKDYYRLIKFSAYANVIFMMLLGLFGYYFQIAQKINEEYLLRLLERFNMSLPEGYTYKISSQGIYIFAVSFAVFIVMVFRGLLNLKMEMPFLEVKSSSESGGSSESNSAFQSFNRDGTIKNFDACPAFKELDEKQEEYAQALSLRK